MAFSHTAIKGRKVGGQSRLHELLLLAKCCPRLTMYPCVARSSSWATCLTMSSPTPASRSFQASSVGAPTTCSCGRNHGEQADVILCH